DVLVQVASAPSAAGKFGESPYLTVKEALDRAAARIGQRFQDQPLVEASIRTAIGMGYTSLQEYQPAVPHLKRAVALREAPLGPDHPDTVRSLGQLVEAYMWLGRHRAGIALRQQLLESCKARLGPDHPETLACLAGLAGACQLAGEWDEMVRLR